MSTGRRSRVREVLPDQAWTMLEKNSSAVLVDVRTAAEWSFVGQPDISESASKMLSIEWQSFPNLSRNTRFEELVMNDVDFSATTSVLFICRSGARSLRAAEAIDGLLHAQGVSVDCINVAEGFEGDLNAQQQRGHLNGWKARGLPWRQA